MQVVLVGFDWGDSENELDQFTVFFIFHACAESVLRTNDVFHTPFLLTTVHLSQWTPFFSVCGLALFLTQ